MLKELFEAIGQNAVKAAGLTHLTAASTGGKNVWWDGVSGKVVTLEKDPHPRAHTAHDLDTVVQWAKQAGEAGTSPVVWYSRQAVSLILDDATRRDFITLPLSYSQPMLKLQEMHAGIVIGQAELIWLLRTTFRHSLRLCPTLIELFRGLRWESATDSQQRGVSLGKSIEARVMGKDALPESFVLECPCFAQELAIPDVQVEVAVDIDHGTQKFRLLPIPGMVERMIQHAEQAVGDELRRSLEDAATVSFGKP